MYLKYICCYDYTYIIVTWLYTTTFSMNLDILGVLNRKAILDL